MKIIRTRLMRLAYALAIILVASCGHEKASPKYSQAWQERHDVKLSEIPWIETTRSTQNHHLFSSLPDFASDLDKEEMDGQSSFTKLNETDIWVNIVASMPYAMPFYCDPVCYEPSIILSINDCQPYIFALFYYAQNPGLWYQDDGDRGPWIPQYPINNRGYYFRPNDRKGYCVGR